MTKEEMHKALDDIISIGKSPDHLISMGFNTDGVLEGGVDVSIYKRIDGNVVNCCETRFFTKYGSIFTDWIEQWKIIFEYERSKKHDLD